MAGSSVPRFFAKSRKERLDAVADLASLSEAEIEAISGPDGGIPFERADKMIENAVGTFALPLGIATNFAINGRDLFIPMAIEEPSVIAAASKAAKAARALGGFEASADESLGTGQVQLLGIGDVPAAMSSIAESSERLLAVANSKSRTLSAMGRGAKEISCREIDAPSGKMLIAELLIDTGDAMGANVTNAMCEAIAPALEEITGGRALLRILSNYSTRRVARARAVFAAGEVGGERAVQDMVAAFEFADNDVYRAVTHNKGIMNGVVAVANATGQDSRAIEAAANAYAARSGRYRSLSRWESNSDGNLVGTLELPLSVGTVGGVANVHPVARACVRILGVSSARELGSVMAAAGLAQNYGAMRALVGEGIQRGHMRLHARNLAAAAGAGPGQIDGIVRAMIDSGEISAAKAKELLDSAGP